MKSKLIIGIQPYLDLASQLWSELDPELKLVTLEINQDSNYFFDLSELAKFSPKQFSAFVACDHQFLNFRRLELMSELKKIGFCMPSLLAKSAYIGKDAIIGENCFICPGTVIGPKAKLGFNCFIGSLSSVNQGAVLGNSVWLGTESLNISSSNEKLASVKNSFPLKPSLSNLGKRPQWSRCAWDNTTASILAGSKGNSVLFCFSFSRDP